MTHRLMNSTEANLRIYGRQALADFNNALQFWRHHSNQGSAAEQFRARQYVHDNRTRLWFAHAFVATV